MDLCMFLLECLSQKVCQKSGVKIITRAHRIMKWTVCFLFCLLYIAYGNNALVLWNDLCGFMYIVINEFYWFITSALKWVLDV